MSDNAEADAMAAEILAVQMRWIAPEECTYRSSPSIAGLVREEQTVIDDDGQSHAVIVWNPAPPTNQPQG